MDVQLRPDPCCLEKHSALYSEDYIDNTMRAIAISWLVEVACEFRFHQETLHMAAALLDRFLSSSKACKAPCTFCYRWPGNINFLFFKSNCC